MTKSPALRLDSTNECLWRDGERINLTPKGFAVLRYLAARPQTLVRQQELLEAVWPGVYVQPEVLKKYIREIRKALGDDVRHPRYIETFVRRGYRFIGDIPETAPGSEAPVPSPEAARLFGRASELERLNECLDRSLAGNRQVVFVTGEAGIGKTSLADVFQAEAARRGCVVSRGQSLEGFGEGEACYPVLEAIAGVCRGPVRDSLVQTLRTYAPTWLVQFPFLLTSQDQAALRRELLGASEERMLREVCDALEAFSQQVPMLLILEDVHWADLSTLDVISTIARRRGPASILLVVTCRPVDVTGQPALQRLLQDLLIHRLCEEIALGPLPEDSVAEYLAAELRQRDLPEGLTQLVFRRSDGNPLFMQTILRDLVGRGVLDEGEGGWRLAARPDDMVVPDTLRNLVNLQVDRLDVQHQRALEAATCAGVVFPSWAVAAAMEIPWELAEELCEHLAEKSPILRAAAPVLVSDGLVFSRYEFVHSLYRQVLYQQQPPVRRMIAHRRIGERLEELYAGRVKECATELAMHFEEARDWLRAVRYLRLAAESAAEHYAHRESAALLRRALILLERMDEGAGRVEAETGILEKLAIVHLIQGEIPEAIRTLERSEKAALEYRLPDVELRAINHLMYALTWVSSARCLELIQRAQALAHEASDPLLSARTRMNCAFFRFLCEGWDEAGADECRKRLDEIRQSGDRYLLAAHLSEYSYVEWVGSRYCDARRSSEESLPLLREAGDTIRFLNAQLFLCWQLLFLGEWGEALRVLRDAIENAEKNGHVLRACVLRLTRAWLDWHAQAPSKTLTACEHAIEVLESRPFGAGLRVAHLLAAAAHITLGEYGAVEVHHAEAQAAMDRQPILWDWYWRMQLDWNQTELLLAQGNIPGARDGADRFLAYTLKSNEKTWQAFAWNTSADVCLAERNLAVPKMR